MAAPWHFTSFPCRLGPLRAFLSCINRTLDVGDMMLCINAMIAACLRICHRSAPVSPPTKVPWGTVSSFLSRGLVKLTSPGLPPGYSVAASGVRLACDRAWSAAPWACFRDHVLAPLASRNAAPRALLRWPHPGLAFGTTCYGQALAGSVALRQKCSRQCAQAKRCRKVLVGKFCRKALRHLLIQHTVSKFVESRCCPRGVWQCLLLAPD